MSDHHQATGAGAPPTRKQQSYIRRLAMERGITFTPPRTRAQASRLIRELQARPKSGRRERRRELKAVRDDIARGPADAARVREDEITGYGSEASWKGGER